MIGFAMHQQYRKAAHVRWKQRSTTSQYWGSDSRRVWERYHTVMSVPGIANPIGADSSIRHVSTGLCVPCL